MPTYTLPVRGRMTELLSVSQAVTAVFCHGCQPDSVPFCHRLTNSLTGGGICQPWYPTNLSVPLLYTGTLCHMRHDDAPLTEVILSQGVLGNLSVEVFRGASTRFLSFENIGRKFSRKSFRFLTAPIKILARPVLVQNRPRRLVQNRCQKAPPARCR